MKSNMKSKLLSKLFVSLGIVYLACVCVASFILGILFLATNEIVWGIALILVVVHLSFLFAIMLVLERKHEKVI